MEWRENDSVYRCINKPWPTEAAACCSSSSFGLDFKPNGAKPAAIAPEVTTNTSMPRDFALATASTRRSTELLSRPAPALPVSDDDPTLTTMRFARVTSLRIVFTPIL